MPSPLFTQRTLPSGEQELVLATPVSAGSTVVWGALGVGLCVLGLALLTWGFCFFGVFTGAIGAWGLTSVWRLSRHRESWIVQPGTATQVLAGSHRAPLTLVQSVRLTRETDSDDRELVRVQVVHGAGQTDVGAQPFEKSEEVQQLAQSLAGALGVPVREG